VHGGYLSLGGDSNSYQLSDAYASPAISEGQIFLRVGTDGPGGRQELLYCISEPPAAAEDAPSAE